MPDFYMALTVGLLSISTASMESAETAEAACLQPSASPLYSKHANTGLLHWAIK